MMIRSFLPVGQGAFYCECFDLRNEYRLNVIYDCGSATSVKFVEQAIKNNFTKGETIHAVFISHLDEDHINGIPYLLRYCRVEKIFFPLITEENRSLMNIYYSVKNINGFLRDFFDYPYRAISALDIDYSPQLIQIEESIQEDFRGNSIDVPGIRSGENLLDKIIDTDSTKAFVFEYIKNWLYIPFNFRQKSRIIKLKDELTKIFHKDVSNELSELWKSNDAEIRRKIKEAYDKVPGGFNTNSMTLFSGIKSKKITQTRELYKCCLYICEKESGCLYMGDYDAAGKAKWEELKCAYGDYWNFIGCIQIPHHGSQYNFNEEFLRMDAYFIISCGYSNKYHHPHAKVMKLFLVNHIMPYIVTEQVGSSVYLLIK